MITTESSGVWGLEDIYNKVKHTYYLPIEGGLYVSGPGNLGLNDNVNPLSFTHVPGDWSVIDTDDNGSGGIKSDGTLWTWGNNLYYGGLGHNDTVARSSPTQIPGTQWSKVAVHSWAMSATKTDGTLWAWGRNDLGQLGFSNIVNYSSPTQLPGNQWSSVHGRNTKGIRIKNDGTLWISGPADYGMLGLNDTWTRQSSPTQLPGTQWIYATDSDYDNNAFGLKSDGSLWAWGQNGDGTSSPALGQNNHQMYSSPVQIPGTWSHISVGTRGLAVATKTDGTLWSWGDNVYGRLGHSNQVQYSSPTQLPGTQWSTGSGKITTGYYNAYVVKNDGSVWGWGELAQILAGANHESSPIQLPGRNWTDVYSSQNNRFYGLKNYTPPS